MNHGHHIATIYQKNNLNFPKICNCCQDWCESFKGWYDENVKSIRKKCQANVGSNKAKWKNYVCLQRPINYFQEAGLILYISVSQPVCRGTLVWRELLLGVPPNIYLDYFSIFTHFHLNLFLFNTKIRAFRCSLSNIWAKGVPQKNFECKVCQPKKVENHCSTCM